MGNYFAIQWHITDYCDQRCKHCYIYSDSDIDEVSMSLPNMILVTNKIIEFCNRLGRTPYIYLTGGDPILHPHFWDLLEYFHKNKIRFCIMGNPFHLTLENLKRMKELGCVKYQVSLDGLSEIHDYFRKKGSFDATIKAIKLIKQSGMWVAVMSTVSKMNYQDIPKLIDLVSDLGVDVYAVGRYSPTSIKKAHDENIHMTPLEYKSYMDECYKKYNEHKNDKITFHLKDHLWNLYLYEKGLYHIKDTANKIYDGCNIARNHITILPNGSVYACRRMDSMVGSIYLNSLYDIWTSKEMDEYRKYDEFVKCKKCELLRACRGCPSVTYGYTHNMYDSDPQCWKEV